MNQIAVIRGAIATLPTPYRFGSLDMPAFEKLCERLIKRGISALVVCSTTGEASLLAPGEHHRLIYAAASVAARRVPVVAGAGSNNTEKAVELARSAELAGASALLCVTPYFLKPTEAGMMAHFRAVHDAVRIPVILHDVPERTACSLTDVAITRLASLPRIAGLKDAAANVERVGRLRRRLGPNFLLLSGADSEQPLFRAAGGDGCVSIAANVTPALCSALQRACDEKRTAEVERIDRLLAPLHEALSLEINPIPLKRALHRLGLVQDGLRLPLTPLRPEADRRLGAVLDRIMPIEEEMSRLASESLRNRPRAA